MSPTNTNGQQAKGEVLKSGTYLNCYCPHCNKSFNHGEYVEFIIENQQGEKGNVKLSPYLNVFTRESSISLPEGENAKDLSCPNCRNSLIATDRTCDNCGKPVALILVAALTKIIPFYVCLQVGSHWHGLSKEDEETIHLDESEEW